MLKHKIIIIGGGWYGCHSAMLLKDNFDIILIEQKNDIFKNSSYYNQNRLHLGFHYPRNYNTRNLCNKYYSQFIEKYGFCIDNIDKNYYIISKNSLIDYNTYVNIYSYEKFDFQLIDNNIFNNIDGKIIKVNEQVINSDKIYYYFKEKLNNIKKKFNTTVTGYYKKNNKIFVLINGEEIECDLLLDCTYNQLQLSNKKYIYELTISLLFKKINNNNFDSITVMDGKFLSLYPRDINKNIYTLTDVEYTPLYSSNNYKDITTYNINDMQINSIRNLMLKKILEYYPNFNNDFIYDGYFISKKTKQISNSDSRDIIIEEIEENIISVNCGKIYGIFDFEKYLLEYIKKFDI